MVELDLVLKEGVKQKSKDSFHHYQLANCKRTPLISSIKGYGGWRNIVRGQLLQLVSVKAVNEKKPDINTWSYK